VRNQSPLARRRLEMTDWRQRSIVFADLQRPME